MKRFYIIIYSLLIATLHFSCNHEETPLNVILLVDFTPDSATVGWYKSTVEESILNKMTFTGRLTVLPVDYGSQASSQEIFKIDFSKNNYENEYAGLQADELKLKGHHDSIAAATARFDIEYIKAQGERASFHNGTDIFGALKQARKYYDPSRQNVLVLLSDMLQVTNARKMNFEQHLNDTSEIATHLKLADKADLSNVRIIVLTGKQKDIRPEKFNVVKSFWEKYFQESGGVLIDYSSGAVSKLESILH